MKVFAIIPAAGQGRRFGGAKQFRLLRGKALFLYSVQTFESSPLIDGVCLVVPESDVDQAAALIQNHNLKKTKVVAGGSERQESVKKGFHSLPPCGVIVVHDGVRPFVTNEIIEKVVQGAREWGGAVAGTPVKETTKKVGADLFVRETIDRENLWSIQTPQAFRFEIFQKAVEKAEEENFIGTDEAMLVEKAGFRVKVVPGSFSNIKITAPEDMDLAEAILAATQSGGKKSCESA